MTPLRDRVRAMRSSALALRCSLFLATFLALGCGAAQRPAGSYEELKVTRAVLYQNGIGYFERRGRIRGDLITLRIRPDQIADILKSLTVVDLARGHAV